MNRKWGKISTAFFRFFAVNFFPQFSSHWSDRIERILYQNARINGISICITEEKCRSQLKNENWQKSRQTPPFFSTIFFFLFLFFLLFCFVFSISFCPNLLVGPSLFFFVFFSLSFFFFKFCPSFLFFFATVSSSFLR